MKKIVFALLVSAAGFSQQKVYNVQKYCIDKEPFAEKQCDIKGNEYSFVFVDESKKQATLFLSDQKIKYDILERAVSQVDSDYTHYILKNENGKADMRINRQQNKVEFLMPGQNIYLTVGKSTKAEPAKKNR